MLATPRITTNTVVVTSSVPMLNHGSLGPRRSGTEMEKRPGIAATVSGRPADGEEVAGVRDEARPAPPRP